MRIGSVPHRAVWFQRGMNFRVRSRAARSPSQGNSSRKAPTMKSSSSSGSRIPDAVARAWTSHTVVRMVAHRSIPRDARRRRSNSLLTDIRAVDPPVSLCAPEGFTPNQLNDTGSIGTEYGADRPGPQTRAGAAFRSSHSRLAKRAVRPGRTRTRSPVSGGGNLCR